MVNNRLLEWLKTGIESGYSIEELKKKAIEKGYSEKQVDDALKKIKKKLRIFLLLIFIFLIVLAVFFYFKYTKAPEIDKERLKECIETNKNFPGNVEEVCYDLFYYNYAHDKNNSWFCRYITSDSFRERCIKEIREK